eukprot:scaffold14762_cov210-Skeletonema_marinoi.AAC.9
MKTLPNRWSFGPDTGFIGGLPPEIMTLPKALKEYAQSIGEDYATSYSGKWGLQGATWTNSPMGAGFTYSCISSTPTPTPHRMKYAAFQNTVPMDVMACCLLAVEVPQAMEAGL